MMRSVIAAMFAVACAGSEASAQIDVSAQVGAVASDNLFRLPDATPLPSGLARRDVVTTLGASALATTVSGNWTGTLRAEATPTFYVRNTELNNLAFDLSADALRQTPTSGIRLRAGLSRRQTSFVEFRLLGLNQQQRATLSADATYTLLSDFRLVARGGYLRTTNSAARARAIDVERLSAGGGIGYYSPAENYVTIEAQYLDARGMTPRVIALDANTSVSYRSSFTEMRGLTRAHWAPTVALVFDVEAGYAHHDDRSQLDNDISGAIWNLRGRWLPRDALRFRANVRRGFETEDSLYTNGIIVRTVDIGVEGDVSPLEMVAFNLSSQNRQFRFDPLAPGFTGDRREHLARANASLSRVIGQTFRLTVSAGYERRTSSQAQQRFDALDVGLSLVYRRLGAAISPSRR